MERRFLPLPTSFGLIRRARPADSHRIVHMVGQLAAYHGDTPTLTHDDLLRDLFSEKPWISIVVAEIGGVGRSLVEACKIEAVTLLCRYLAVGTHPDNHNAQAFYTSLGFERRDAHPPRFSIRLES